MIILQAGIKNDQLTLVQGPEAELMYNRTFTRSPSTFGEYEISPLPKNYRSILVHLGGQYDVILFLAIFVYISNIATLNIYHVYKRCFLITFPQTSLYVA